MVPRTVVAGLKPLDRLLCVDQTFFTLGHSSSLCLFSGLFKYVPNKPPLPLLSLTKHALQSAKVGKKVHVFYVRVWAFVGPVWPNFRLA